MKLSRYIFSKYFSKLENIVKYPAFIPHKGEVSVFKTENISETEIWEIGKNVVAPSRLPNTLKARADVKNNIVLNLGLKIEDDPTPHPLHANITNWSSVESKNILKAMEIARNSILEFL